jgi:hypothetical protein
VLLSIVLASEVFVSNKSLDAKLVTYRQEHSSNDGERRAPAARGTADGEVVAVLAADAGAVVCAGRVRPHRQED